jgi:hypothetical protein
MPKPEMPSFTKSPPELVERFGAVMDRYPDVDRRKMFGYPAGFVGGNMVTGLFADDWVVRLAEGDVTDAFSRGASGFEPVPGRPMKSFVAVPRGDIADDVAIASWVEQGIAQGRSMPAKEVGARKRR